MRAPRAMEKPGGTHLCAGSGAGRCLGTAGVSRADRAAPSPRTGLGTAHRSFPVLLSGTRAKYPAVPSNGSALRWGPVKKANWLYSLVAMILFLGVKLLYP